MLGAIDGLVDGAELIGESVGTARSGYNVGLVKDGKSVGERLAYLLRRLLKLWIFPVRIA